MRKESPLADLLLGSGLVHAANTTRPTEPGKEHPADEPHVHSGYSSSLHAAEEVAQYPYPTPKRRPSSSRGFGRLSAKDKDHSHSSKERESFSNRDGHSFRGRDHFKGRGSSGEGAVGYEGSRSTTPPLPPALPQHRNGEGGMLPQTPVHVQQLSLPPCLPSHKGGTHVGVNSSSTGRAAVGLPNAHARVEQRSRPSSREAPTPLQPLRQTSAPDHQQQQEQQQQPLPSACTASAHRGFPPTPQHRYSSCPSSQEAALPVHPSQQASGSEPHQSHHRPLRHTSSSNQPPSPQPLQESLPAEPLPQHQVLHQQSSQRQPHIQASAQHLQKLPQQLPGQQPQHQEVGSHQQLPHEQPTQNGEQERLPRTQPPLSPPVINGRSGHSDSHCESQQAEQQGQQQQQQQQQQKLQHADLHEQQGNCSDGPLLNTKHVQGLDPSKQGSAYAGSLKDVKSSNHGVRCIDTSSIAANDSKHVHALEHYMQHDMEQQLQAHHSNPSVSFMLQQQLQAMAARVAELERQLATQGTELVSQDAELAAKDAELAAKNSQLVAKEVGQGARDDGHAGSAKSRGMVARLSGSFGSRKEQQDQEASSKAKGQQEEVAMKQLRALKAAEAATEKAEQARRGAERKAALSENEAAIAHKQLAALKAEHVQALEGLQSALASSQHKSESMQRQLEGQIVLLQEELTFVKKKAQADADQGKKGMQETIEQLRQDLVKRTQTILDLNGDCELAQQEAQRVREENQCLSEQLRILRQQQEQQQQQARDQKPQEMEQKREASPLGKPDSKAPSPSAESSMCGPARGGGRPDSCGLSKTCSCMRRSSVGMGPNKVDSSAVDVANLMRAAQTQVAEAREAYARRLAGLEAEVQRCEAICHETVYGAEQLFRAMVSRIAGLLVGRHPQGGPMPSQPSVSPCPVCATSSQSSTHAGGVPRTPTPAARAALAAATAGQAQLAVLYAMNDRLSKENAGLLGELARFQTGKHPILRRQGLTTLGADPSQAAPSVAEGNMGSSGGHSTPRSTSAGAGSSSPLPFSLTRSTSQPLSVTAGVKRATSGNLKGGFKEERGPLQGQDSAPQQQQPQKAGFFVAREALSAAVKEVLLCSRKELLPAVVTAEGWAALSSHQKSAAGAVLGEDSRAEGVLSAAEINLQLRTLLLAAQAQAVRLQAEVEEATNAQGFHHQSESERAAELRRLKEELAGAGHQVEQLQEECRRARSGTSWGHSFGTADDCGRLSDKGAEEREQAAMDEAQRHRNAAAAAKRDAESAAAALSEAQAKHVRLEMKIRDLKYEASKQEESVVRLRMLLTQARALLKDAGVTNFMADAPETPGDAARKPPQPDENGPLFKATEAREREKEVARLKAEATAAEHTAQQTSKELKRMAQQLSKHQQGAKEAAVAAAAAAAEERSRLVHEANAAKEAQAQLEHRLSRNETEVLALQQTRASLASQLERLKLDTEYLRVRAHEIKSKRPKLGYTAALSITIAPART